MSARRQRLLIVIGLAALSLVAVMVRFAMFDSPDPDPDGGSARATEAAPLNDSAIVRARLQQGRDGLIVANTGSFDLAIVVPGRSIEVSGSYRLDPARSVSSRATTRGSDRTCAISSADRVAAPMLVLGSASATRFDGDGQNLIEAQLDFPLVQRVLGQRFATELGLAKRVPGRIRALISLDERLITGWSVSWSDVADLAEERNIGNAALQQLGATDATIDATIRDVGASAAPPRC